MITGERLFDLLEEHSLPYMRDDSRDEDFSDVLIDSRNVNLAAIAAILNAEVAAWNEVSSDYAATDEYISLSRMIACKAVRS